MTGKLQLLCLCTALSTSACKNDAASFSAVPFGVVDKSVVQTADSGALAHDLREGALAMYAQLGNENLGDNLVFSPFALQAAVAMMDLAAEGDTATDVQKAMRWSLDANAIGSAFKTLTTLVATPLSADPNAQLETGTRTWTEKSRALNPAYAAAVQDAFQASIVPLDIKGDATGSVDAINTWVAEQTHGLIENLLPSNALNDADVVQTAALYVKAFWQNKMYADATPAAKFTLDDGSTVDVSMLHATETFGYTTDGNAVAVDVPYGRGSLAMFVVVPKGHVRDFAATLDANGLESLVAKLQPTGVTLSIPQFKTTTEAQATKILEGLGMSTALSESAQFAIFSDAYDRIARAFEKATITVDENGTTAAAAAAVVGSTTSAGIVPENPTVVTVDRPFLYFLRDTATNTILFMGQVGNPAR